MVQTFDILNLDYLIKQNSLFEITKNAKLECLG